MKYKKIIAYLFLVVFIFNFSISSSDEEEKIWVGFAISDSIGTFNKYGVLENVFSAEGLNSPYGIAFAPNGKVYISSRSTDEVYVFDFNGNYLSKFSHPQLDGPSGLIVNDKEELLVCSYNNDKIIVFDLDTIFLRSFSHDELKKPRDITIDSHGSIYVTSYTTSHVIKFDENENYLFFIGTYPLLSYPTGITISNEDIIFAVGQNSQNVVLFDTLGNFIASLGQDSIADCQGIAVDDNGHYYVSGFWQPQNRVLEFDQNHNLLRVIYLKNSFAPVYLAIKPPATKILDQDNNKIHFRLNQNYPNPFNPTTEISWQSPVSGNQSIKVYDVLGNEVATLVDEYKPAGSYEVEFNAGELPSGVYFYRLSADEYVETKKMIFLK